MDAIGGFETPNPNSAYANWLALNLPGAAAKQAADTNRNAQIAAQQTAVAIGNAQQAALQAADDADWLASGYDCLHWSDARWRAAKKAY